MKKKPLYNIMKEKIENSVSPSGLRVNDCVDFRYPSKKGRYKYRVGHIVSFTVTEGSLYFNILSWRKDVLYKMVSWDDIGRESDFQLKQPK